MNRYEVQAGIQRKAALRSSMSIWTGALALIVVALLIMGLRGSANPEFFYKGAAIIGGILLVLRLLARRLKSGVPKAAQPDPKSMLKLS